jgi:hypothetical protein
MKKALQDNPQNLLSVYGTEGRNPKSGKLISALTI